MVGIFVENHDACIKKYIVYKVLQFKELNVSIETKPHCVCIGNQINDT